MHALWAGAPATARELRERVAADWAYTTVKTLLQRLVDKGAVAVELRGNTGHYTPLWQAAEARRSALRSLLESAFEGSFGRLFVHLARDEALSADEVAELSGLLDEHAEKPAAHKPAAKRGRTSSARTRAARKKKS